MPDPGRPPVPTGPRPREPQRHREGIPMFLVLEDLAADPAPGGQGPAADGHALAELAEGYRRAMLPQETDPGEPQTAAILEAMARDHFHGTGS